MIRVASKWRPLKSSLDRRFSFSARTFRIMGHLRHRRGRCGSHPQRRVNTKNFATGPKKDLDYMTGSRTLKTKGLRYSVFVHNTTGRPIYAAPCAASVET